MERIHVSVRARPLSPEDAKTSPWRLSGNSISMLNHPSKFEFDRIFGDDCKTSEVYRSYTRDIVAAAVRGFNGTVFAYGQTNSGKTHTMRGSPSEPGVIPLAVRDLFSIIQEDLGREFLLRMSYMEIYNEEINDLLAPEHRRLQIHENLERGIYVAGLREEIVASPEQVLDLMEFGESHRHIGETNMNVYSSRSHTIFRMIIESRDKSEDEDGSNSCDAVRVSVLNLVDLAGSERAAKTGAEGVRLKEGSHINKSLMTLGTVIKKLSEGAESQGGHVPYRDSKLTRILQPALGGNANTAIICNITLAQIHADETKSSLQFASRALRVTNCAHVNEILTDAALLKRQKKEIEELRAKLQGSHSEHLGEEILNLRNTLLQTELERERIALELEEEKKAQAEWEKRLQEQAKKIENLSSMVLNSNRDENQDLSKKKRRVTWCPGKLSEGTLRESQASALKPTRPERGMGPLLPFDELENEIEAGVGESPELDEGHKNHSLESCSLPDPGALLHVTNRRKVPARKKSLPMEDKEHVDIQAEYEDLFMKSEIQKTLSDIQIDCLYRKLAEVSSDSSNIGGDKDVGLRELEAIVVIKQLQEQIKKLELEKSSSQQNLDTIAEVAMEQNICARVKFEELYKELLIAREEARAACEQLTSGESMRKIEEGNLDSMLNLSVEVQEIISEVENSKKVVESVTSLVDEAFQSFSSLFHVFHDFKAMVCESSVQQKLIISNHEKLQCCMRQNISDLENEKLLLYNQSVDFQKKIEELRLNAQSSEKSWTAVLEQQDQERNELVSQILTLQKELSCLSSCSLAKEKEILRKDVEKVKIKLKETESKLKNALQEKTKLEGDRAFAEREIKRLLGQKTLLERDISKRDSLAGRRRDSVIDRSSKGFDPKKTKGFGVTLEQTMQEDYKKLEVLAFEMETTIASLEEELAAAYREKEDFISTDERLDSDMEALSEQLSISNLELNRLQEEVSHLRLSLEESNSCQQKLESSIKMLLEEKEELAMQLSNSLLEMEEEKAIWSAKEKASIGAIEEKDKLYNAEVMSLSKGISEVRSQLESCREECKVLKERLACSEENEKKEKESSREKSLEIDQLKDSLRDADIESKQSQDVLKSNLDMLQKELNFLNKEREDLLIQMKESDTGSKLSTGLQDVKNELHMITREKDRLMNMVEEKEIQLSAAKVQVEELTHQSYTIESKMHTDGVNNSKDMAKLRMRLRGTQAKLDAFRYRHEEAADELDFMNRKYEEASRKLKDKLASYGVQVLNLKKQLATAVAVQGQ